MAWPAILARAATKALLDWTRPDLVTRTTRWSPDLQLRGVARETIIIVLVLDSTARTGPFYDDGGASARRNFNELQQVDLFTIGVSKCEGILIICR